MIAEGLRVLGLSALVSSAAILLVLLLRKPMRAKFGAHAAYALWLLVPLVAAVAFLPAPVTSMAMQIMSVSVAPALILAATVTPVVNAFDPLPWLGVIWTIGFGISLAWLSWQQQRFVRALGRLSAVGERIVRAEATVGCPALVGAWKPRVVLPADFERRYSATECELILAHERAHCARGDAQLNVFAALLRCVFWFNPLVHIAASRFRFDQELACDAAVVARFPEARRSYADAMLKTQLAAIGLPAGCYWQSSHPLKERISMLRHPLPGRTRAVLGLALTAALIGGGTYVAWAAQPVAAKPEAKSGSGAHATYRKLSRIVYPAPAISAKAEGVVYVDAHIAIDGAVISAEVERAEPLVAKVLAEAAVAGVKNWTFNPATKDGKPTASDEIVPIVFAFDPLAQPKVTHGTLDAIRIAPQPQADSAASTTADSPPTEDVGYRMTIPPHYPETAIAAKQSGKIVLKVLIDERGNPKSATVFKAEPAEAEATFADASIAAAMQWKFNPGIKDGKPLAQEVLVPFTYSLTDDD